MSPNRAAIIADIRARRAVLELAGRRHRRRGPLPHQQQPDAVRLGYFRALLQVLGQARALVKRVEPRLEDLVRQRQLERGDARLDMSDEELNELLDKTSDEFFAEFTNTKLAWIAEQYARRTSGFQREQIVRQFKNALGIDIIKAEPWLEPRIREFTAENVALIKSIPQRYFEQVEQRVIRGMREGLRWEEIAKNLDERFEVAEGHTKLVARDQVGKFFGELNRQRQKDLGITDFIWRTARDNRVREEHEALEGEKFQWDEPPIINGEPATPGSQVNCRCQAEPVLGPILEAIEGPGTPAPAAPVASSGTATASATLPLAPPAPPAEPQPPQTPEELHRQRMPAVMEEVFGEKSHSTGVEWNSSTCDNWGYNGARDLMTGRIQMSSERSRHIAGAVKAAARGVKELGPLELAAFKTYTHEHIHGLGKFRQVFPLGTPITPTSAKRFPGVSAAMAYQTAYGSVLEEGSTELLAVRNYRTVIERLGFKVGGADTGPIRSLARQDHSYLPHVRAVEILIQRATGQTVQVGGDLGTTGEKLLSDLNTRWNPMKRPRKLAEALANTGTQTASRAAIDMRTDLLESYIREVVPRRVRADEFEQGFRFHASMEQEIRLLQDAQTTGELVDLKKKLGLP